ncbi:MAG: hypothetical protein Q9159_001689 [Coniocarpon cinnabarinum]
MSQSFHLRSTRARTHTTTTPSPLRHASNASSSSETSTTSTDPFAHTRTNTLSSIGSLDVRSANSVHKRGISETSPTRSAAPTDYHYMNEHGSTPLSSRTNRESLRPLSQAPNVRLSPTPEKEPMRRSDISFENENHYLQSPTSPVSPTNTSPNGPSKQSYSLGVSRSDSRRVKQAHNHNHAPPSSLFEKNDFEKLGKSTTKELRALSKFAEEGDDGDFSITNREQEVIGMHGRRRLQRNTSKRAARSAPGYGGRTWMDTQRQFLQAYEYLCHIGEAKEWIEDVIHHDIPPIVQLEEALRDGVVLAEIVQTLQPQKSFRIFRNPRLQFRHSDNIAIFFRFLADVELPELFRFELVDLYEKKNIPKVIYCIHALSWILLRRGLVDFRIGNLVGQLQFEDHELEATQKGLDRAGVSMPNFSGMGEKFGAEPEPPPEPRETEEERIERELHEHNAVIQDLQSQVRGALERLRLGDTMQHLWDSEESLVDLQSRVRGDFARQISDYRTTMRRFAVELQCLCRGHLVRSQLQSRQRHFHESSKEVVTIQSLFRARKSRAETQRVRMETRRHEPGIKLIQAAIRGAFSRRDVGDQLENQQRIEPIVHQLQHRIRGALARKAHANRLLAVEAAEGELTKIQAHARGLISRRNQQIQRSKLTAVNPGITALQSRIRAAQSRKNYQGIEHALKANKKPIIQLQARIRARKVQSAQAAVTSELHRCSLEARSLPSSCRAFLQRRKILEAKKTLEQSQLQMVFIQASSRAYLERQRIYNMMCKIYPHENAIVELQSTLRAINVRNEIGDTLEQLEAEEQTIVDVQSEIRGKIVRKKFAEKQAYFRENMKKVVQIQSFVRGKQQGQAYKSLTSGKNPPVNTVKNFVHLLNDSDLDFEEEVEVEKLRKAVGSRARDIEQTEQWIADVDAKIGLLAHNKITRDELKKTMSMNDSHRMAPRFGSVRETFNTKALNKSARAKFELYQQLFVILQTQTVYLARLSRLYREQGASEEQSKRLESLTISTYGFAQKRREEFYLLGLISSAIVEEAEACASFQDFQRCTFFFTRLFMNYARAPRDRKYIREANAPFIKSQFFENPGLDLESDPLQIYRGIINDEELRTGRRSEKPVDIPREMAIKDADVRPVFVRHLQDLRDIVDQYLSALEDSLKHAPFGARFVARQMFNILCERYPSEDQNSILRHVGSWVWKTYLKPALADPEKTGTVERALDSSQKRNIGELVKVMNQAVSGRRFGDENVYLQPLNNYLDEAIARLEDFWMQFMDVPDAEEYFDIDTMDDIHAKKAPTLYMKWPDILAIHRIVADHIRHLCLTGEDADLAETVRDLGSVRSNEAEMGAYASSEVMLTLSAKFNERPDPDADIKNLFMETKRCILYIIRIQSGPNLMDIMVKPITEEEHLRWEALVAEEQATMQQNPQGGSRRSRAYTDTTGNSSDHGANLAHLAALSYPELKGIALENILVLEQHGRLTRQNNYQDLLNEIALDIRQKHKRRVQRAREAEHVRLTLAALDEKAKYLDEKLDIFNKTFEMGLNTLQSKSQGKKRFLMPFSLQWQHEKELEKLGRMPKYGSFKYKATTLLEKGILVSWRGRDLRDVEVTIASDEVNVFTIEGSRGNMMLPGACDTFQWDDLLQSQYEEQREIRFFSDADAVSGGRGQGVGELVLDREAFMRQVSKKFWPEG